jgi:hypothetical protein
MHWQSRNRSTCIGMWHGWPDWANFLPLGDFLLWAVMKTTEEDQCLVSSTKKYAVIMAKKELGYILGDFFTNPSGRPGSAIVAFARSIGNALHPCWCFVHVLLFYLSHITRSKGMWLKSPRCNRAACGVPFIEEKAHRWPSLISSEWLHCGKVGSFQYAYIHTHNKKK